MDDIGINDWKHSHPLDLSDEGLLEDRVEGAANKLALVVDGTERNKRKK